MRNENKMNNLIEDNSKERTNEEISYEEILSTLALNGEVILTIPAELVETLKSGIKNCKSKQAARLKEDGLMPDQSTLSFNVQNSEEYEGAVDVKVILERKGVIPIIKMTLPDNTF